MSNNTAMPQSAGTAAGYNVLAIVGFILAFVFNIAGLVVSLIALSKIKKTGERGRGLALAGVIISIVSIIFGIIYIAVILPAIMSSMPTTY
jgi:peptidyl-prolyl cis-trans isomerase B (cyclophilin B)